MTELEFQELETRETDDKYVVGFRMRKRRNWKYRYVSAFLITNSLHDHYQEWVILAYGKPNSYFIDKKQAKVAVDSLSETIKQEFITGKRNWWTGRTQP